MENFKDVPLGLAFQMSMNEKAMENFSKMTEDEKRQVLEVARSIDSKEKMQSLVEDLGRMS